LGAAALLLLCWVAAKRVRLVAQGSTNAHEQVGLIPVAGLLAAAKALSQVGVPVGEAGSRTGRQSLERSGD
jgi:hypothetical protein